MSEYALSRRLPVMWSPCESMQSTSSRASPWRKSLVDTSYDDADGPGDAWLAQASASDPYGGAKKINVTRSASMSKK